MKSTCNKKRTDDSITRAAIEALEERRMMSTVSYDAASDTLTITAAGDGHDDAISVGSYSAFVLRIKSSHYYTSTTTTVVRDWSTITDGPVAKIIFNGSNYAESFTNNTALPCQANGNSGSDSLTGGTGDDTLSGGDGNDTIQGSGGDDSISGGDNADTLYGSTDNDTIHGGDGDDDIYGGENGDDLYGDGDDDELYGGDGDDGVYGGAGTDQLTGGDNQDRFLYFDSSELVDNESEDAKIKFENADQDWTESEVEEVDKALAVLHRFTGNDNLLETKGGGKIVFKRGSSDGGTFGTNSGGTITLYNKTFDSKGSAYATVIHEIGHNWDDESSIWGDFKDESDWSNPLLGSWSHDASDDDFVVDYGQTNPYEDFATVFELYFMKNYFAGEEYLIDDYGSDESVADAYSRMLSENNKIELLESFLDTL
jgi:Ca2+-binding RTX toxin-like protein